MLVPQGVPERLPGGGWPTHSAQDWGVWQSHLASSLFSPVTLDLQASRSHSVSMSGKFFFFLKTLYF